MEARKDSADRRPDEGGARRGEPRRNQDERLARTSGSRYRLAALDHCTDGFAALSESQSKGQGMAGDRDGDYRTYGARALSEADRSRRCRHYRIPPQQDYLRARRFAGENPSPCLRSEKTEERETRTIVRVSRSSRRGVNISDVNAIGRSRQRATGRREGCRTKPSGGRHWRPPLGFEFWR